MNIFKRIVCGFMAALVALTPAVSYPAFDPVNDDTDIFLANPNVTAARPNVLLVIDNSANWNQPFTNEKAAIASVVNGLTDQFNVGLMIMSDANIKRKGSGTSDGAYIRSHIRQMTNTNKSALASIITNFDIQGDKGDNNLAGMMMYEAYLYFKGLAARAGDDQSKADHDGTTDTNLTPLTGHALPGPDGTGFPTENGVYRSPIVDGCQKNFIIFVSNGPANENASQRSELEGYLSTLTSKSPPDTIAITPNGQQGNWADEMAKYMANADIHSSTGTQNVITYTVEVNPVLTGQGPAMSALLDSMATNGKGKYFPVTDDAGGVKISEALNQIFAEINAVNSVFAASTLPVSINVRGTNINQVYVGVFRPDAQKKPRWLGNLKMYQIALDTTTNTVFLADANVDPAINPSTGFITSTAQSFWTAPSTYWGFRTAEENGSGGVSDSPDGELVEKGGAAQKIRTTYPNAETPAGTETLRKIYTCTSGGAFASQCAASAGSGAPGSSLSATPFADSNTDITTALLQLGTRSITTLTGFETKSVSSLVDRRTVTLNNAAVGAIDITALSNGATTRTITSLTTSTPRVLTSLSAAQPAILVRNISTITKANGANKPRTVTTTTAHGFTNGQAVVIADNSVTSYNGTFTVSAAGTNTFEIGNADGNTGTGTGGTATVNAGTIDSTTAVGTLPSHGFAVNDQVTIAGASPSQFNGTVTITAVPTADTFQYFINPAAGTATGTITASAPSLTATATTSVVHGFLQGTPVTISGASPNEYNGTFTIVSVPSTTTFTYTVSTKLTTNTASPVYAVQGGSTTVTATAPAHGFADGQTINITGADVSGYNGTFTITLDAVDPANVFTYTTASVLPANNTFPVKASAGTQSTVTATLNNHGFGVGDLVIVEGGTQALHTSSGAGLPLGFTVTTVPDANTFTYENAAAHAATAPPTGTYTARPPTLSTRVYATLTGHGYASNDQIVIAGADPTGYNGTHTITVVDASTFYYPLTSAPGTNTSTSVVAKKKTTTARATSPAHGFATNDSVTIAGATEAAFNGTFTITVTDPSNFTYTLPSAQGDATGTSIVASGTASGQRTSLIKWVRGEDNFEDENVNSSNLDIRASVHGDVLHSRPAVVNYNRFGGENDVYIYYGANDGIFHAIKGGRTTDTGDASGLLPGQEAWGFIPQEHFGQLNRLRTNTPIIGSSAKKPYFMDGSIAIYTLDANNDGKFVAADNDRVILYITNHRGGRFVYALDVSDPLDPKFMWKIDTSTAGFAELGHTWSTPVILSEGLSGYPKPVIVFAGGYDPFVEDLDPNTITAFTATSVTTAAGTMPRSMGRAIYVADALTGAKVWSAGGSNSNASNGAFTKVVAGMDYAIPSDVTIVRNESGGDVNRGYVGDTGGNLWRIDFKSDNPSDPSVENLNGTTVTKIASIADPSVLPGGLRKFLHAPDVVGQEGFDAVLIGSGDREHPFDTGVVNRFYMFKDLGGDAGPVTGTGLPLDGNGDPTNVTIVESALFDASNNCIQDCSTEADRTAAQTQLGSASGWYITLRTGEKVVGNAVTLAGTTFFATNQPQASVDPGVCTSSLGIARQYAVSAADATATVDYNSSGGLTISDRSVDVAGGGYLPSPTQGYTYPTRPDGTASPTPTPFLCFGVNCGSPQAVSFNARVRKYWYKEVDQ